VSAGSGRLHASAGLLRSAAEDAVLDRQPVAVRARAARRAVRCVLGSGPLPRPQTLPRAFCLLPYGPARARRADAARAQAAAMAAASAAHCTAELLADVAALAISLLAAARDDAPQPLFNAVGPPRLRGAGPPDGFGVPGQMEGLQFGPTGITVLPGPVAPPGFAPAVALAANGPAPGVRGGGGAGVPAWAPPQAAPAPPQAAPTPPGPAYQARPAGVQLSAFEQTDVLRRGLCCSGVVCKRACAPDPVAQTSPMP